MSRSREDPPPAGVATKTDRTEAFRARRRLAYRPPVLRLLGRIRPRLLGSPPPPPEAPPWF